MTSKRSSKPIYKISICNSSQLTCYVHFFFMPATLLRTYHVSKILQFDNGTYFLLKIHINFYYRFCDAAYEKVHLDLLQSFLKIRIKTHSYLYFTPYDQHREHIWTFTCSCFHNTIKITCKHNSWRAKKKASLL